MIAAVLTIGGSDSCGGAGIQADLRVFDRFAIKGCSAITALTAQNPNEILRIEPSPAAQLEAEIRAVFSAYEIKAVKTGMLYDAERIKLVASLMQELHTDKPIIVDPVMLSSSGTRLLANEAVATLVGELLPLATLITPNIPEAEALQSGEGEVDACALARELKLPVLLKGGHLRSNTLLDVLCIDGEKVIFPHNRQLLSGDAMHGTGCRLASAIAASIALGQSLPQAVAEAVHWHQQDMVSR